MPTIIIQNCLYSPGHGVYQSFTGSHWNALPLLPDHVGAGRYLRLCAHPHSAWGSPKDVLLGSSLETCLASPSPLPSASSVKQWSSWRCVWSHSYAGILPCDPVSRERGSCSAAVFHCICWSSYFPQWNITLQHLQTMTFPPPCLTADMTHLSLYSSPGRRHACLKPLEPN